MSREWDYWDLQCGDCGNKGTLEVWTDDWNRWGHSLSGFDGVVRITGVQAETIKCEKCRNGNVAISRRRTPG
jgi:hypothetical protein